MDPQNYEFIMNAGNQPKRPMLALDSKKQRIVVFGAGIALLVIVLMIFANALSASSRKASDSLLDLAAYQTELTRIVTLGTQKTRDANVKNKAITASITLQSDYSDTAKMVNNRRVKIPKELATRYAGGTSDQLLDAADKANNFDAVYIELYTEKLTNYKNKLAEVFPNLSPNEQAVIKKQNQNAKILLGEPLE
jgi:hypothetical protein